MKTKDITAWMIVIAFMGIIAAIGIVYDLHRSGIYQLVMTRAEIQLRMDEINKELNSIPPYDCYSEDADELGFAAEMQNLKEELKDELVILMQDLKALED